MDVRPCRSCKQLFNYLSGPPICPACRDAIEKKFIEVKEFVRENPTKGVKEVSDEMEVSVNQIKRWIKEDRLQFSEESGIGIECESCGTMIRSGRLCSKCKDKFMGTVDGMYSTDNESIVAKKHREAARMRFLDK